jgi:hypothetical protein
MVEEVLIVEFRRITPPARHRDKGAVSGMFGVLDAALRHRNKTRLAAQQKSKPGYTRPAFL